MYYVQIANNTSKSCVFEGDEEHRLIQFLLRIYFKTSQVPRHELSKYKSFVNRFLFKGSDMYQNDLQWIEYLAEKSRSRLCLIPNPNGSGGKTRHGPKQAQHRMDMARQILSTDGWCVRYQKKNGDVDLKEIAQYCHFEDDTSPQEHQHDFANLIEVFQEELLKRDAVIEALAARVADLEANSGKTGQGNNGERLSLLTDSLRSKIAGVSA